MLCCLDWASSQTAECMDVLELRGAPIIIFKIMSYWVFSLDSVYEAFHHIVQQKGYHVLSLEINTRWSSCTPSPTFLSTTIGYAVEIEFLLATATYSFWKSCISRILCSLRFVTSLSLVFAVCCKRSNNSLGVSIFFQLLFSCSLWMYKTFQFVSFLLCV